MKESRDLSITIRKSKQSEKCQDCQFTSQLIQIPRDDLTDFIHSQKHVSASSLSMITYNGLTFKYAALLSHLEPCCCTQILSHSLNFSYYIHKYLAWDSRRHCAAQSSNSSHGDFFTAVLSWAGVSSCDHVGLQQCPLEVHVVVRQSLVHCSKDLTAGDKR